MNALVLLPFLFVLFFKKPLIGNYFNPLFWKVIVFGFLPFSLLSLEITQFYINPALLISALCSLLVIIYMPLKIELKSLRQLRPTPHNYLLIVLAFALPFMIQKYNINADSISSFASRNDAIKSLPLSVVAISLNKIKLAAIPLCSGRLLKLALSLYITELAFSTINFSYTSSKGFAISIIIDILTFIYISLLLSSSSLERSIICHPRNRVRSLLSVFSAGTISKKLICLSLFAFAMVLLLLYMLLKFDFGLELIFNRIVLNFDTLYYLSFILDNHMLASMPQIDFGNILFFWLKPFPSLVGIDFGFAYKSVSQYIMSVFNSSFYEASSLGNSNLVAESVVLHGLAIGTFLAPALMILYILVLSKLSNLSNDRYSSFTILVLYLSSYEFFAMANDSVMYSVVIIFLLQALRLFVPALNSRIRS